MLSNKIIGFFKSYKLLVTLSIVLTVLSVEYIAISTVTDRLDNVLVNIKRQLRTLRIDTTKRKLSELDKLIESKNYPKMHAHEARRWVLETAENFRVKYDAKIKNPPADFKGHYSIDLVFTYLPEKPEDFINFVNYLETSVSPLFRVKSISSGTKGGVRDVRFDLEIIQPYFGGEYDI